MPKERTDLKVAGQNAANSSPDSFFNAFSALPVNIVTNSINGQNHISYFVMSYGATKF